MMPDGIKEISAEKPLFIVCEYYQLCFLMGTVECISYVVPKLTKSFVSPRISEPSYYLRASIR